MMDFMFFVKTFALTIAVVLVMQIPVGEQSIEAHTMGWVQNSGIVAPMHLASQGAVKMVHDLSHQITQSIHDNVSKGKKEDSPKKASSFRWTHSSKSESN